MKAGARTYVLIEDELLSSTIYVSDLVLEGMGLRRLMNSTVLRDGIDFEDARLVDSVIEQWMKLRPDIVASTKGKGKVICAYLFAFSLMRI